MDRARVLEKVVEVRHQAYNLPPFLFMIFFHFSANVGPDVEKDVLVLTGTTLIMVEREGVKMVDREGVIKTLDDMVVRERIIRSSKGGL